ncbi:D-serine/D-alanine/glycine transporter [Mycolicibacterium smegmatis]|uniref:D-serine/D-alanine/glycine transporter n=1 Tax=Mycolicibacterium smegmatis TaxID=1772 RepID=UPI0005D7AD5C|nr:D-serine/D-alanine/glycine transporter [Mycolicibacterium smegmatis]MDF1899107.1 D-serine/D-alanine/glycine transporter [Mycolicibacterium smegmatis]MDF1904519.1 D-serine/D-alanine/glycine transporter [Mycolicibacterium smegmatis]MDF1918388.1 D-serine/D-alanine/glycine transporter [Mycolicibacterium smegmatis]MDF1923683.1 D-serine/D-alanine/glycine transporter [Mycolicibacterium smegmatis]UAK55461.1 D-serine/D-alanine/glycine transporter [Mycolicibacterium smegmatis]
MSEQTLPEAEHLSRQLSNRHIQLIAIGGAIGTGLFMGSGKTVSLAGPSVIFVYMIIGFMLFFVMRAMGELLLSNLEYKSFADFAADLLGPWAGFFTGWTYWFCWIVTGVAEVVAIAGYVAFWWPGLPLWIPALVTVAVLITLNLATVRAFGETEFWFAMIKIVAILALIVVGLVMVLSHFRAPGGAVASLSNLWDDGGFFPTGPMGFVAGFQIATFAFVGIELVGTTAAEARDPERNLPRAVNSIPVRVMLFYVAALVIIIAVTPWREISPDRSPFVAMFSLAGLGIAASVVNFVVLTSAASSANSGIYSTSRMVYGLSSGGDAPASFGRPTSRRVPANALFLSGVVLLSSVVMVAAGDSIIAAFTLVTTISSLCFMFIWTIILSSYLVYRRRRPQQHSASPFKMPGGVVMCWVVLAFFVFLVWAFTQKSDTLQALLVTPAWFVVLGIAWAFLRRRPGHKAREAAFRAALEAESADSAD